MIFTKSLEDAYICDDWCDIRGDDAFIGVISRSSDGYWRFNPARKILMTCGHCKRIAKKLSELNDNTSEQPK